MFLEKCLFRFSSCLKIGLLFLFFFAMELSCMGSLYSLDINPLLDIWFANNSLPFYRLPFHLVDGFVFGAKLKNLPSKWMARSLSSVFFPSKFHGFRSYFKVFNPFGVNFCVWCKTVVQFHSFAYTCPLFNIINWPHCPFPIVYS